ncbi:hypothetical protein BB8028_0003g00220 [Beauveria bassiana]|uniref:Uncharacterized protein n=1 Tax=Beauveria bassiana TaxID=176275 RepID=A0A2S7Y5D9_BEABA|nr:hypothetical protein BB8028_0003g00220 [Beauveria bassiana]
MSISRSLLPRALWLRNARQTMSSQPANAKPPLLRVAVTFRVSRKFRTEYSIRQRRLAMAMAMAMTSSIHPSQVSLGSGRSAPMP